MSAKVVSSKSQSESEKGICWESRKDSPLEHKKERWKESHKENKLERNWEVEPVKKSDHSRGQE